MLKSRQHKIGRSEDGEVNTSPPRSAAKKRIEEAATKVSEFQDKDAGLGQPEKRATKVEGQGHLKAHTNTRVPLKKSCYGLFY